jgi:endonuclease-3
MQSKQIDQIFERFKAVCPEPKTELDFVNDYTLLVAVILSAQATDKSVNKATNILFTNINTPQAMLEFGEDNLKKNIKSIGLFNSKAKNIIAMSSMLLKKFNGLVPIDFQDLCSLPGVGSKTANVFLNCAYQYPTIGVDTHVFRVSNRIGLITANNVKQAEQQLNKKISDDYKIYAHHWLILHGRYICKARTPLCKECLINDLCQWPNKNIL